MTKHNALAERLNAVREGQPIPEAPSQFQINTPNSEIHQNHQIITYRSFFISEGYKLFNVLATSALYGIGIKTIFSAEWSFIGSLGIGFLLNHFLTIFLKLLKKQNL
jgi:hypothetical protein